MPAIPALVLRRNTKVSEPMSLNSSIAAVRESISVSPSNLKCDGGNLRNRINEPGVLPFAIGKKVFQDVKHASHLRLQEQND